MTQRVDLVDAMKQLLRLDMKLEIAERDAAASEWCTITDESDFVDGMGKDVDDPSAKTEGKDQLCFVTATEDIDTIEERGARDDNYFASVNLPGEIVIADATTATRSTCSVQSSIARNKSLCSTLGGKSLLTVEEDERVSTILDEQQEDDHFTTESQRDTEIDEQLHRLGIQFSDDSNLLPSKDSGSSVGDPYLRDLAEKRALEEKEKSIDMALRALLRAPLQIASQGDNQNREEGSLTTCSDTVLSSALTEEDLRLLIEEVKQDLDADGIKLEEHDTIRSLFESMMGKG